MAPTGDIVGSGARLGYNRRMAEEPTPGSPEEREVIEGRRNAWIVTGYGLFALILVLCIAYAMSQILTR